MSLRKPSWTFLSWLEQADAHCSLTSQDQLSSGRFFGVYLLGGLWLVVIAITSFFEPPRAIDTRVWQPIESILQKLEHCANQIV